MRTRIKEVINNKGEVKFKPQVKFSLFESTAYRKMRWLNLVDIDLTSYGFSATYSKLFSNKDDAELILNDFIKWLNDKKGLIAQ